ncbi:Reticulocyte-binding protein 2 homolog a [Durusdinium trenchii]|uniref:Reticulocyte-binding protein 2 homolog a n=1 Tax=Durusdinium trenchii TaxID=1381693 RepID=A0ABP0K0B5_9DINO
MDLHSGSPTSALPSWVQVGAKCRWWSESQQTHHVVVITSVDDVKRRVVAHFAANQSVWKAVPFSQIASGPLRPPEDTNKTRTPQEEAKKADGRATPPWYEQLNMAETRMEAVQEIKRKEESHVATQERRRYLWQQEQQRRAEEEHRQREVERQAREAAAERERLRILEKLKKEREEEQLQKFEGLLMSKEDEVSTKANALWRQREDVARRQREEEERQRLDEEQYLLAQKLEEERASRPRIAFGLARQDRSEATAKVPAPAKVLSEVPQSKSWESWEWPAQEPVQVVQSHPLHPSETFALHRESANGANKHQESQDTRQPPQRGRGRLPIQSNADSLKDWYTLQIRAVYEKHNPEKLADVPHLMQKYAGCEEEMYDRICEKYGVMPQAPPANRGRLPPPPPPAPPAPPAPKVIQQLPNKAVGFARKASAPAPPAPPAPAQNSEDAPSTSDLMARFQNLVQGMPRAEAVPPDLRRRSRSPRRSLRRSPRKPAGGRLYDEGRYCDGQLDGIDSWHSHALMFWSEVLADADLQGYPQCFVCHVFQGFNSHWCENEEATSCCAGRRKRFFSTKAFWASQQVCS